MKRKPRIILALILLCGSMILIHLPWFTINGTDYTMHQAYTLVRESSRITVTNNDPIHLPDNSVGFIITVDYFIMIIYQVILVLHVLACIFRKTQKLDFIAFFVLIAYFASDLSGFQAIVDNMKAFFLPECLLLLCGVECLSVRLINAWKREKNDWEEYKKKDEEARKEEKRRLDFPGNYTRLFYHIIWKNFKYSRTEFGLYILSGTIANTFIFSGLGIYELLKGFHRQEYFLFDHGLGTIMWNAMLPMGICILVLMAFVMIYYLKKRTKYYSIFVTLGIRKRALYLMIGCEFLCGFLCSYLLGILLGNGLILIFKKIVSLRLGMESVFSEIGFSTILKGTVVIAVVYLAVLLLTRSILSDFNLIQASTRNVQKEKIPRRRIPFLLIGIAVIVLSVLRYSKLFNYESIYLLLALFAGIYLCIRFGGAQYLLAQKKRPSYLKNLMTRNQCYHKSKTTAWYLLVVTVFHVCAVGYFGIQAISVTVAQELETLFPYDFVCIAGEQDNSFFEQLKKKYDAELLEFPMVRVSNADKTENVESPEQLIPQGQQIGVSETTYHELKKLAEPEYKKKPLGLDKNGEKIYVVHQQDRSVKAQPLDWALGKKEPFIHIGLPCEGYNKHGPGKEFPRRTVVGEEIGSLIGCFRQGKLENLVVFSDEYFKKAQELWKVTDSKTGEFIEDPSMRIEGVSIMQGPTKLVLLNAGEKDIHSIEKEMKVLEKNHEKETGYDSNIKSYYSKASMVVDLQTEYFMKLVINLFVILIMLVSSIIWMYIKIQSEIKEKQSRAQFLKCMGMRRNERIRLLKKEVYLFYWLPGLITVFAVICLSVATFHARMYPQEIIGRFLKNAAWLWGGYFILQMIAGFVLGRFVIRKVEGKDE